MMQATSTNLAQLAGEWAVNLPQYSDQIERERCLPASIARQFADQGLFHLLVPVEYGGLEVHPSEFVQILKALSMGDGSAGWHLMIGATTGLLSASLSDVAAREIYGTRPGSISVGVTAPLGRADKVDGGYRVTGRWPFGSGSQNADWICGGCLLFENDEPLLSPEGAPISQLMLMPAEQVEIEDTWRVSGLRGTGSHHFNVKDIFVPAEHSITLGARARVRRPLYQFPILGLLAIGVASVSLGIGFKALAAFTELAGVKLPTGSSRGLAERSLVQSEVAKSLADLKSAEAFIHQAIDEAWSYASAGERLSTEIKANLRLAAVNATQSAAAAVDRLYQAGGSSSIYESSELQRCFRDIHVTTQHIMVAPPIYEVVGRVALGLAPKQLL